MKAIRSLGLFLSVISLVSSPLCAGNGKFLNPITDVCWKCMFPLQVAGYDLYKGGETSHSSDKDRKKLCHCPSEKKEMPTLIGVPVQFWEPSRLIDVTMVPYKLKGFGGMRLSKSEKQRGASYVCGNTKYAFYQVHVYEYPLLNLVGMANDLVCTEFAGDQFEIKIAYLSEKDPAWNNEKLLTYLNPEMLLFANPIAQVSCSSDCIQSSIQKPNDLLFWCAGCQGSLYPLFGFVAEFVGPLQASLLLVQRAIAKLHLEGLLKTYKEGSYCKKEYSLRAKRTQYKTQLLYPVASTKGPCNALGKTEIFWGANKSFPVDGEDFTYILWTQRRCCLDPAKATLELGAGL